MNCRSQVVAIRSDLTLKAELDGLKLRLPLPRLAPAILPRIDGRASLGEIRTDLQALDSSLDWPRFKPQFGRLYAALNGLDRLVLSYPS